MRALNPVAGRNCRKVWASLLPFEDYATCDSQVEACTKLTTEEIVASILPQEEEEEEQKISAKEALMCLQKLKSFVVQQIVVAEKVHESLDTVTHFMITAVLSAQVQQKITAFYKRC